MILSPLENSALPIIGGFTQTRPVITQKFGLRPEVYSQFGLKGHDGIDFKASIGTSVFTPFEGIVTVEDSGDKGYGLHIRIRKDNLECVLGHLSKVFVNTGDKVYLGDRLALSGNTGFTTAPHLHIGLRQLQDTKILNYDNGFFGYYDFINQVITWKGSLVLNSLIV